MENNTSQETREILVSDVDKLKADAVQVVQDVRNHAQARVDETRRRIQTLRESLMAHPFSILGVGFGLGFLFGVRFRR
jgi:ElaB/YqjD/DUF883 family membrane-anchored ribosome-binding protein